AMPLIHPQSIPLSTVLLAAIAAQARRDLWLHKWKIIPPLIVLALLNYQYVKDTLQHLSIPAALAQGHPSHTSRLAAFLGAFRSARLITPHAFDSPLNNNSSAFITLARRAGLLPIPLTILGLLAALWTVIHSRSGPPPPDDSA